AIVDPLDHHSAVQIEQDTVEGALLPRLEQAIKKLVLQRGVVGLRDQAARIGEGPQQRLQVEAMLLGAVDEASRAVVGAAEVFDDGPAPKQTQSGLEVAQGGGRSGEGARLVR